MTSDQPDLSTGRETSGNQDYPGARAQDPALTDDQAYRLDDTGPIPATSGQTGSSATFGGAGVTAGTSLTGQDAASKAQHVAEHAKDEASDLKETAADKAAEVKDVALERGGDVADVARDELGRVAADAREQFQALWEQTSSQLRDQATAGRKQLAELLHSLAGELGEMASKSEQDGPVTALAKQASRRGGELSHWLANADSADVVSQIRRFARRRPSVFLAGATVAGVVVGRLSRGLMAGNDTTGSAGATRAAEATDVPAPRLAAEVPAYGGGTSGQTYGYDRVGEPDRPTEPGELR